MRVRWTRLALRDLETIVDYVAKDNAAAATRMAHEIRQRLRLLADHPEIGRPGRIVGTRELMITGTSYIVPYRVRDGEVEIVAVFHGARRWPDAFD